MKAEKKNIKLPLGDLQIAPVWIACAATKASHTAVAPPLVLFVTLWWSRTKTTKRRGFTGEIEGPTDSVWYGKCESLDVIMWWIHGVLQLIIKGKAPTKRHLESCLPNQKKLRLEDVISDQSFQEFSQKKKIQKFMIFIYFHGVVMDGWDFLGFILLILESQATGRSKHQGCHTQFVSFRSQGLPLLQHAQNRLEPKRCVRLVKVVLVVYYWRG